MIVKHKIMYDEGTIFDKNANPKKIGNMYQKNLFSFLIANIEK